MKWIFIACSFLIAVDLHAAALTLKTANGDAVSAIHNRPQSKSSSKGVLLLHMEKGSAGDWFYLTRRLNRAGLNTLAIDLRGHGESPVQKNKLEKSDYGAMKKEVQAGVDWLAKKGFEEIIVVGAVLGANLALEVAAKDPRVSRVALLSPGLNIRGVRADLLIKDYGQRPIYIAVSVEDKYSTKTSLLLDSQVNGPSYIEVLSGAGKGTYMLHKDPNLITSLQSWLNSDPNADDSIEIELEAPTGDREKLETTGEKLPGF